MVAEISIVVDGQEIRTEAGKTIIQAATESGLYIPYLCYYPGMKPFGACRMCVVEVENMRGTPASCTTPVADGMIVNTNTPQIQDVRKGIVELVVSEHPHGCITCHRIDLCGPEDICQRHVSVNDRCVLCPKNERCELKDTTRYVGTGLTTPLTYNYRELPVLNKDPFYDMDYNLCIVCGRCVRACEELRGDSAITFTERAGVSLVGPAQGDSLLESGCEFCGSCIDVCPVGALVETEYKWEKAVDRVSTTCPHCPVGCQLKLEVDKRGRVIRSIPELEAEANHGQACFKGKFGLGFINSKSRLKSPLIRRNGSLEEASWDEAIKFVADNLDKYKTGEFMAIGSYRGTNEENYLLQKFTRTVMGTNNVDHATNTKPDMAQPLQEALGYQAATNPIWDLENTECIMVLGANVTEDHNVVGVPIKRAAKNGTNLIVIDPREIELTRYANLWIKPNPGTEGVVLGGMLKVITDEVLEDEVYLQEKCENIDGLKNSLWQFDLKRVESITGVSPEAIREAARSFAQTSASAIVYALDNIPLSQHIDCARAIVDLALVTGNLGKSNAGIYPLRPGTNDQGSWDVGCVPNMLPGYINVEDQEGSATIQTFWNVDLPKQPGVGLLHATSSISEGIIRSMLVVGDSPSFSDGSIGDLPSAVKDLEFLVVQDSFMSALAESADVVLPSVTFAEKEGTYTNIERRVQPLRNVLSVDGNSSMPDWWVTCQIARAMNASGFDYHCAAQILDEISTVVSSYSGIAYQSLLSKEGVMQPAVMPSFPIPSQLYPSLDGHNDGIQWPTTGENGDGTSTLYMDSFYDGKASLLPININDGRLVATEEHPFLLIPGRVLHQPQRDMDVVEEGRKNYIRRDEILELNVEDANELGFSEDAWIEIKSPTKSIVAKARRSDKIRKGTVAMTSLFGEVITELEASTAPDPMSRVDALRIVPVKLEKVE